MTAPKSIPTTAPPDPTTSLALIGLGPRGVSTLERLTAALIAVKNPKQPLTLHLIDDAQHGGGRIWDTEQTDTLCMNTLAHGMTLFSEPGATVTAPIVEGPTLYEWIQLQLEAAGLPADSALLDDLSPAKRAYFISHPPANDLIPRYGADTLRAFRPESFLPRAIYGFYVRWVFSTCLDRLPEWVTVQRHVARATAISRDSADTDTIELSTGTSIEVSAIVAVTGWQQQGLSEPETELQQAVAEHHNLQWFRADNPIEQGLDAIPARADVLIRGLGMSFFDTLALATIERGGSFRPDSTARSGLVYEATGTEPTFFATSSRGYPFLPQGGYDRIRPPSELPRTKAVIKQLSAQQPGTATIDYGTDVWPAVARDAYAAYLTTLARVRPQALKVPLEAALQEIDRAPVGTTVDAPGLAALDAVITAVSTERFSLSRWTTPLTGHYSSTEELTAAVAGSLEVDIAEAAAGEDSPVLAALWSVGCARKPTQILGAEGRYTHESRTGSFDRAIALGQMACSGPPLFRTCQLLALVDAGIVQFVGARPTLDLVVNKQGTAQWALTSQNTGKLPVTAEVLVDAWVHKPSILDANSQGRDALIQSLIDGGIVEPFAEQTTDGQPALTDSPAQHPQTRRFVTADGGEDPRIAMVGIPAHAQYPDTTISPPVPGTDPWFIQETDLAAVHTLQLLGVTAQVTRENGREKEVANV